MATNDKKALITLRHWCVLSYSSTIHYYQDHINRRKYCLDCDDVSWWLFLSKRKFLHPLWKFIKRKKRKKNNIRCISSEITTTTRKKIIWRLKDILAQANNIEMVERWYAARIQMREFLCEYFFIPFYFRVSLKLNFLFRKK